MNLVKSIVLDVNQAIEDFFAYASTHPPVYIAFVLACLCIIAGVFIAASNIRNRSQIRVMNPKGDLDTKQQQAINVGAIMGAMFSEYCNSLQTKRLRETTTINGWGIYSSADAWETTSKMITGEYGQRNIFNQILGCLDNDDDPLFDDDDTKYYAKNLKDSTPLLLKEHIISAPAELSETSMLAWDMGRLVNISRWSYDLGYITESAAWEAINIAYGQVLETYNNWQEFAKAYLIGRAMWGGPAKSEGVIPLKTVIRIAKRLLKYANSPWNVIPFK